MSREQDFTSCGQCSYLAAEYEFDCATREDATGCRRCGYTEYLDTNCDEKGNICAWKRETSVGAGALWCRGIGDEVFCCRFLKTGKEVLNAEQWLRKALDKGLVDPDVSYLTRWNRETEQVEVIIGFFYEWPETDGSHLTDWNRETKQVEVLVDSCDEWPETDLGEIKGEVVAPVPSSQPTQSNSSNAEATATATAAIARPAMEISVSKFELLRELTATQGVLENETTIPILSNLLFEAAGDRLTITATDLDLSLCTSCAAKVEREGACTIPARKLYDHVKLLPDGDISIKLVSCEWVSIRSGRSNTEIAGRVRPNFPRLPTFPANGTRTERHRRFQTGGLEELSVRRYDEAIGSLGVMGKEMSSRLTVAPQVLLLSTISKPKSIEIP
jgi:hypothetical protein